VFPVSDNEIWGSASWFGPKYASALFAGVRIGPKGKLHTGTAAMAWFSYGPGTIGKCRGPWDDVKDRYLGLKFRAKDGLHYGWARLNVTCSISRRKATGTLTGYAYETIPGKSIIAGKTKGPDVITVQPASLGRLAQGASGISAWRKTGESR
jgi:hypothetical protein